MLVPQSRPSSVDRFLLEPEYVKSFNPTWVHMVLSHRYPSDLDACWAEAQFLEAPVLGAALLSVFS